MTAESTAQTEQLLRIKAAATALLARIDTLTTDEFQLGGERTEREALRVALAGTPRCVKCGAETGADTLCFTCRHADSLKCNMANDCARAVTHIDNKGWIYCAEHGKERKESHPTRQLRAWELKRLREGKTIAYERYSLARFMQRYGSSEATV